MELEAVNQIGGGDSGAPEPCAFGRPESGSENGGNAGVGQADMDRGFGMTFSGLGRIITVPSAGTALSPLVGGWPSLSGSDKVSIVARTVLRTIRENDHASRSATASPPAWSFVRFSPVHGE